MTARAPRRSQPPKARGGEGGTEHEHGQGKATNGGRTAGEAAQRTKASGAMAGRSTIGRRHPGQKRRRGPPSEASRQRRGRRGGHRAEPPKERAVKATTAPNSFIWWRSVQSPWRLHQMLCLVQLSALLRQRSHPAGPGAGRRSPSRKRPAEWGGGCRASESRPSEQCDSEQCEERRDRASKPRTAGGTKDNS